MFCEHESGQEVTRQPVEVKWKSWKSDSDATLTETLVALAAKQAL